MINDASVVIGGGNWGIKEADVLGYKLINDEYYARDIDFANSTAAGTYTDSTGVIRRAPYNLFQYSEQFDNAAWSKSALTIGIDATVAPNGTLTADKLQEDSSNGTHIVNQPVTNSNSLFSFSVYAKKSERDFLYLQAFGVLPNNFTYAPSAYFNLNTGVVSTVSSATATIESVGNGWYRCTLNCTSIFAQTSASVGFYMMTATASGVNSYAGTTGSGIFIWGAQLVQGTEALPYFPTTTRLNVPRIDYRNADGSLSTVGRLLLEPQRSNVLTYSDQFDNAIWTKVTTTLTANTDISPDGTQNADRMTIVDSTSRISQALSLGAGTYTISVYVRVISTTTAGVVRLNSTVDSVSTNFFFTPTSQWARYTTTVTAATGFTAIALRGTSPGFVGTLAVWGFQVETGAYPTTYIPTTTTAVTRNADSASRTGVSSWIGQTEGTLFAEVNLSRVNTDPVFTISDGTDANRIQIAFLSSTQLLATIRVAGVNHNLTVNVPSVPSTGGSYKIGLGYKANDFCFSLNGTNYTSTATRAVPACSVVTVGASATLASFLGDRVAQAALFPTRLTNEQLSQITTL